MLVVEGPDGSGKSTFIQEVTRQLRESFIAYELPPRHCTSTGGPVPDLATWIEDDRKRWSWHRPSVAVWDRHPLISEPIYGPLIRGSIQLGFDNAQVYAGWWRDFIQSGAVFVFCLPPLEKVLENLERTEHMAGITTTVTEAIYASYMTTAARLCAEGPGRAVVWDYTRRTGSVLGQLWTLDTIKERTGRP